MNYKKGIIYSILFLTIVLIGDRIISFCIDTYIIKKSHFRYSELYNAKANADILLIGNSRALCFNPQYIQNLTGKSSFNMSYNGLPSNLANILLHDYIKINGKPKLIVIECTMLANRKEIIGNFGCYSNYSTQLENLISQTSKSIYGFNKILHLTRYNGEVFLRALYHLEKPDNTVVNDRIISNKIIAKAMTRETKIFDTLEAISYKKLIEQCKSNQIPFKLVLNPLWPRYRKNIDNFDVCTNQLSAFIGEPVHDFSLAVTSANYFADFNHLNNIGSEEFMKILKMNKIFDCKN